MCYWVIVTIRIHIVTQRALAGGGVGVGVYESTDLGVVISALCIVHVIFFGVGLFRPSGGYRSNGCRSIINQGIDQKL